MAWLSRTISIDHTKCGTADTPNKTVLVSGTYAYLKTVGNGGKVQSSNGYDIQFFSDAQLTNKLAFERHFWSPTTGQLIAFVNVPNISHTADTVIYLGYGNSTVISDQQNVNGTWPSGFRAVWHMAQDPSGSAPQIIDSTSNGNNGSSEGSMASSQLQSGKIYKSVYFKGNGFNQLIRFPSTSSLNMQTSQSFVCWFMQDVSPNSDASVVISMGHLDNNVSANQHNQLHLQVDNTVSKKVLVGFRDAYPPANTGHYSTTGVTDGVWNRLGFTLNYSTYDLVQYLNGSVDGTATLSSSPGIPTQAGTDTVIGHFNADVGADYYNLEWAAGNICEVYVYAGVLSASWYTIDYNNHNDPSTFYTIGGESSVNDAPIMAMPRKLEVERSWYASQPSGTTLPSQSTIQDYKRAYFISKLGESRSQEMLADLEFNWLGTLTGVTGKSLQERWFQACVGAGIPVASTFEETQLNYFTFKAVDSAGGGTLSPAPVGSPIGLLLALTHAV